MMTIEELTTPFGARGLSLGMLKAHHSAKNCPEKAESAKWNILRDLTVARHRFALSDRAVTVLSALLSFFPEDVLSATDDLLVFPSNAELSRRAHGISEATLRRCLHQLVEAGLILRRDSPNGKRYARRNADGSIARAFGFDLKPLLSRAADIHDASAEIKAERQVCIQLRERVTLLRRDLRKILAFAMDEGISPDWIALQNRFQPLESTSNRGVDAAQLRHIRDELEGIRGDAENLLKSLTFPENINGNDDQNARHKHESKQTPLLDSEPADEDSRGGGLETNHFEVNADKTDFDTPTGAGNLAGTKYRTREAGEAPRSSRAKVPLDLVLRACPDIGGYAKQGIRSWSDLREAAALVRTVLGVSPDAWREAEEIMGAENAAATMAAILQRAEQIRSPGGYLRALSGRAASGAYSPAPVIEALLRH